MTKLRYKDAFSFYKTQIYRKELFVLLKKHHLKVTGSIPSVMWELFGSILTGKHGKSGYGADLIGYEVKSAAESNSSFEYQYHLNTGLEKLKEDKEVDHLFCSYSSDYRNILVYLVKGSQLEDKFDTWIPEYVANYADRTSSQRRQRFRKAITRNMVLTRGTLVMEIKECDLKYTNGGY